MHILNLSLVALLISSAAAIDDGKGRKTRNVEITATEEKVRDVKGYEAVREIHREMDDDHSGSIDRKETGEFMTEDMNMRSSDRARREKTFHGEDDGITVDELWEAWFESDERSWTTEKLVHWLVDVVNLPQYGPIVQALKLDGRILPRLAVHNSPFITELGVKSSVHKQKLRLSALDVVLFGFRETHSYVKDFVLGALVLVLISVALFALKQRKKAEKELTALAVQLDQLNSMKENLEIGKEDTQQVEHLKTQLDEAYKKLECRVSSVAGTAPLILQPLLRKTCEMELSYLNKQRAECVAEMKSAIEDVDKLRKKQSTVLASLKLATGANTDSDHIDSRISALKSRMEGIQSNTREAQERWMEIEALSGFPILYVNETAPPRGKTSMTSSNSHAALHNHTLDSDSTSSSSSAGGGRGKVIPPPAHPPSLPHQVSHPSSLHHSTSSPLSVSSNHSFPLAQPSNSSLVGDAETASLSSNNSKKHKRNALKSLFTKSKTAK